MERFRRHGPCASRGAGLRRPLENPPDSVRARAEVCAPLSSYSEAQRAEPPAGEDLDVCGQPRFPPGSTADAG